MVAIVFSSIVIVRRRLPYEAWYGLHITMYAAIYLAYLHQIPSGNEFLTSTVQSDWWLALYIATLVLLLAYRVVRPAALAARHRLRVASVQREAPDTVSIQIEGRRLDRLGAQAGQFMMWRFLSAGRWWQSHPFSLSAAPDGHSLRLTVKGVGSYSSGLAELRPGTPVITEGPFGRFTPRLRRHDRVTLIAGGIGITPLRAIFEQLHTPPGMLTLIHRVVGDEDRVLHDELEALARDRSATIHYVVGDHRDAANAGLLSASHLRELVPGIADGDVFLCGPPAMMAATRGNLRAAGVPAAQIHTERFALAM
jgi:predicted ferric reductase